MRIGEGQHSRGMTVRWQRGSGMLCLGNVDDWVYVVPHQYGWRVRCNWRTDQSFHQHRWQAKRWAECALGDYVRRNAELAAKSKAFYAKAITAAYDLAACARIVAVDGFHRQNHSENGPSGLFRRVIDDYCIRHGAGTWDCMLGEFS